jgi:hypothetical protein
VTQVEPREGGQLVHDHLGLGLADRAADGLGVEGIGERGPRAHVPHKPGLRLAARHADDVVPVGDEERDQLSAQRPGGAGHEYLHGNSFRRLIYPLDEMARGPVT